MPDIPPPDLKGSSGVSPSEPGRSRITPASVEEPEPIHILVSEGLGQIPALARLTRLENNNLVADTVCGPLQLQVNAFPGKPSRFWSSVYPALSGESGVTEPVVLAVNPQILDSDFDSSAHTLPMKRVPYIAMEDGTQFGLRIIAPKGDIGKEEAFQEQFQGDPYTLIVGRKRSTLAAVYRVGAGKDRFHPLIRKQVSSKVGGTYQELLDGFEAVPGNPSLLQSYVDRRITFPIGQSPGVGEKIEEEGVIKEPLYFYVPQGERIGTESGDNRGLVNIVVYKGYEKFDIDVIRVPRPQVRSNSDDFMMRGGGGGGYLGGDIDYGRREIDKASLGGIVLEQPIALFQCVLVAEDRPRGLLMRRQESLS